MEQVVCHHGPSAWAKPPSKTSSPVGTVERAVWNRFAQATRFDFRSATWIGNGTRDLQVAVVDPGREAKPRNRILPEFFSLR